LRQRIKALFGPHETAPEEIRLDQFVDEKVHALGPRFAHRECSVKAQVSGVHLIWIPPDVLGKIVEGLVRNAVENTPDGGQILVSVKPGKNGPEMKVKDTGIGISEENQRLIFDNYFTAYETMQYSSRNPYDFGAGGKGFDLLRMRIFSERYDFKLKMKSQRCRLLPDDSEACAGYIEKCLHSGKSKDCLNSGGTTVTVQFKSTDQFKKQ
jgi:light-regulated signal transduction histidine kinase (bacteriophytochrome)